MERFAAMEEQISSLKSKNQDLERENAALRARLAEASVSPAAPTGAPAGAPAGVPAAPAALPAAQGTAASMWSTVAARAPKAPKSSPKTPKVKKASPKHREAIVRGFNEVTGPTGYTTVYINRSRRFTKTEVRRNLRLLGAEPRRIIDVSFPARNIIGLLIHRGFQEEFEQLLSTAKVSVIKNFDPLDPVHVADPKYKSLDVSSRSDVALRLQNQRSILSLQYLAKYRAPLFAPVAREYLNQGWISEEDLPSLAPRNALASWDDVDSFSVSSLAAGPTDTEMLEDY
ncbi:hypothetical protein IWQ62_002199 [Dispira parvispora]|uniref:Uncharacterized protein n=2 Tax=Fungi incertae sedis TaxID=112252 RepID=A0A9W8E435_9FUNG|nr:hypothetical protein IWQ62_002199 [Dispira parvispora]